MVVNMETDLDCGLDEAAVIQKRKIFGLNKIESTPESLVSKWISLFMDPMILLLIVSAIISCLVGEWDDAFSIIMAVLIVVVVAFLQEYRSQKSLDALNNLVPHQACCVRNGRSVEIPAELVVPG